jgi:hypothetical protein
MKVRFFRTEQASMRSARREHGAKNSVHGAVEIMEVGKRATWFRGDFAFVVFREEQG